MYGRIPVIIFLIRPHFLGGFVRFVFKNSSRHLPVFPAPPSQCSCSKVSEAQTELHRQEVVGYYQRTDARGRTEYMVMATAMSKRVHVSLR